AGAPPRPAPGLDRFRFRGEPLEPVVPPFADPDRAVGRDGDRARIAKLAEALAARSPHRHELALEREALHAMVVAVGDEEELLLPTALDRHAARQVELTRLVAPLSEDEKQLALGRELLDAILRAARVAGVDRARRIDDD